MLLGKLLKAGILSNAENLVDQGILSNAENLVDNVGKQGILGNVPTMIQPMPIMKATENMGGLASLGGKNIKNLMDMQRNTFSRFLPEPRGGFMSMGGIQTLPPIPVNLEESIQARRQELENLGYDAADVQEILERDQKRGLGNVNSDVLPSILKFSNETSNVLPSMGIPTLGINPLGINFQDLSKMDFSQLGR